MTVRVLIPCHLAGKPLKEGLHELNIIKDWYVLTLQANKFIEIIETSPIQEAVKPQPKPRGRKRNDTH
ncbi:MAG TPA: hypothetical protein VFM18_22265 [Methanosarcina sp.]|nr:hypothetical protein [Methanosarcina sp.]